MYRPGILDGWSRLRMWSGICEVGKIVDWYRGLRVCTARVLAHRGSELSVYVTDCGIE